MKIYKRGDLIKFINYYENDEYNNGIVLSVASLDNGSVIYLTLSNNQKIVIGSGLSKFELSRWFVWTEQDFYNFGIEK